MIECNRYFEALAMRSSPLSSPVSRSPITLPEVDQQDYVAELMTVFHEAASRNSNERGLYRKGGNQLPVLDNVNTGGAVDKVRPMM